MTIQEFFNNAYRHHVINKQPAGFDKARNISGMNPDGSCVYRGPNGEKCAAGVNIPDSEYNPQFEGKSILSVLPKIPHLEGLNPYKCERIQGAHDSAARLCKTPAEFTNMVEKNYRFAASELYLTIPES